MATPDQIQNEASSLPVSTRALPPSPVTALAPQASNTIRNISQTVQEREIIKTAPDVVVYIDGLPYLTNFYINDPRTGATQTLVNFNDHVTQFSANYDTDSMVPNCTISLEVPNYQKYLYFMPGGNNLLATMAQVQVYAKSYWLSAQGDTVYRRVFKGVTSHISYSDNGKTLEVQIQCQGILYLLEKMQVNIHPSVNTAHHTAEAPTIFQSKYAHGDCFTIIQQAFLDPLRSDMFQIGSLQSAFMNKGNPFYDAIKHGYMAKWQAILYNLVKDVHVYGPYKDYGSTNQGSTGAPVVMKRGPEWASGEKRKATSAMTKNVTQTEAQMVAERTASIAGTNSSYYGNIAQFLPFRNVTALDLTNNVIVNRLDVIREVVKMIDFEAYQDIDGKIIVKPPLYNLDVTNLGTRSGQTQTAVASSANSLTNPLTAIYPGNNPFVIYLSEILTENETEDQAAIRRTRTTVVGNALRQLGNNYRDDIKPVGEFIDIAKLAKFGLREEPMYQVPWIDLGNMPALFCHAAAETARANRGYRTYTFTIPMRPELKLGFPVFIPHRDFYAYIKSIQLNFTIGGTATMTVTADSVRRRVLVNTSQTIGSGNNQKTVGSLYTPAPNLILQWTKNPPPSTQTNPNASPNSAEYYSGLAAHLAQGTNAGVSTDTSNPTNEVGLSKDVPHAKKNPDGSKTGISPQQKKIHSIKANNVAAKMGNQFSTSVASYVVKNDGNQQQGTKSSKSYGPGGGYFTDKRPADFAYMQTITGHVSKSQTTTAIPSTTTSATGATSTTVTQGTATTTGTTLNYSVLPYTDDKGYEVISPFPWGRWQNLNDSIRQFTEQGWIYTPTDVNGNPMQDLNDLAILQNTDAFLFAGLGTPTSQNDPSTAMINAQNAQIQLVGGSTLSSQPQPTSGTMSTSGQSSTNTSPTVNQNTYQLSKPTPDATIIVLKYTQSAPQSYAGNPLLSAAQPEDAFAAALLANTQNSTQQLVNVLVSGVVNPVPAVQEQLLSQTTPAPLPLNVQQLNIYRTQIPSS